MDKYYIYEVCISVESGGSWCQLFIGYPNEKEVLRAIKEALKILTDALKKDPEQQRLLTNIYGSYTQLVIEQELANKPASHLNEDTIRIYTYAGVIVGHIKAKILGHAYDTQGAQDDN